MHWYYVKRNASNGSEWAVVAHENNLCELLSLLETSTYVVFQQQHYFDSKQKSYIPIAQWDGLRTDEMAIRCDRVVEIQPLVGHPAELPLTGKRYASADTFELRIATSLSHLVKGGTLLEGLADMRSRLGRELNKQVPGIRIRDNAKQPDNHCLFFVKDELVSACISDDVPTIIAMVESCVRKNQALLTGLEC